MFKKCIWKRRPALRCVELEREELGVGRHVEDAESGRDGRHDEDPKEKPGGKEESTNPKGRHQ